MVERRGIYVGRVFGGLIVLIGALLAIGGTWLVVLQGSPFYVASGVGYVVSGALLWRRRPEGAWLA